MRFSWIYNVIGEIFFQHILFSLYLTVMLHKWVEMTKALYFYYHNGDVMGSRTNNYYPNGIM